MAALYLKSAGWDIRLSPGSRRPADIIASRKPDLWLIQVKASAGGIPRLKGYEVKGLMEMAARTGGLPVVATLRPHNLESPKALAGGFDTGSYSVMFYQLDGWEVLDPAMAESRRQEAHSGSTSLTRRARSHSQGS